jgi:hypothetical protein
MEDQVTGGSIFFKHDAIVSMLEYHTIGARVARALLMELGCPDAAYIEMNAPSMVYACGRCHSLMPHPWSLIVSGHSALHFADLPIS